MIHHLAYHQWSKLQLKSTTLSYCNKILKRGFEDILFWKTHFTLRNFRKNKLSSLDILQNCLTTLENFKVENQDPWKLHDFFLYTPGNPTSFLIDLLNFHMFFVQYPLKSHVLNPLFFRFFLKQLILESSGQKTYSKAA